MRLLHIRMLWVLTSASPVCFLCITCRTLIAIGPLSCVCVAAGGAVLVIAGDVCVYTCYRTNITPGLLQHDIDTKAMK